MKTHPSANMFVDYPKYTPSSYAREVYYGINAYEFIDETSKRTAFRYQVVPDEGWDHLTEEEYKTKGPEFLQEEIVERVRNGPILLCLRAQIAENDILDDATVPFPSARDIMDLGMIKLDSIVPDTLKEQKHIIFDPIPRVKGIDPTPDPLLELRAAVYLISGKERRAAP